MCTDVAFFSLDCLATWLGGVCSTSDLRLPNFGSLNITVGILFNPGSGVLLTTAPEVPLAFMIDLVCEPVGLVDFLTIGVSRLETEENGPVKFVSGIADEPILACSAPEGVFEATPFLLFFRLDLFVIASLHYNYGQYSSFWSLL